MHYTGLFYIDNTLPPFYIYIKGDSVALIIQFELHKTMLNFETLYMILRYFHKRIYSEF